MPKGFMADAIWRTDNNLGTVTVLQKVDDPASVGPKLISMDANGCKKAFSPGLAPVEEGSSVTRLFTRCGTGKDALVGLYLVVPIKAGDETIGAIGVSGAPGGDKDEACANAGIAKITDRLN